MENKRKAIVVGGGFGGLAAALRLRARGFAVTLLDRAPMLGGRAQVYERNGFTFDAGPTVITAPFLFEELFTLFGKKLSDYVDLVPVEPWYRFHFSDNSRFDYGGSIDDTLAEIRRVSPIDCEGYLRLVEMSRRIFDVGFTELAHKPFHQVNTMIKVIPQLARLKSYRTVYGLVSSYIKHPLLRRAFSLQPLLVGGNPFDTTSIYSLIHYLERRWGVYFPMGGTGALVLAIEKLLREEGVKVHLGQTVTEILVSNGDAQGVRLHDGTALKADLVVVNGDPPYVYKHMIAKQHRHKWTDKKIERLKYSMGLFVLYFGAKRKYEDVAHHTIIMGERYKGLLHDIFNKQKLATDLSLYLHRPTATDSSMAPSGCDSFYVLSPVPNLQASIDWKVAGPSYRNRIVEALERTLLPDLRRHITEDFYVTPIDFQQQYLSHYGTGFSIAPIFSQSAYFRFHNKAEDIENLYFVGAGTHPGAGVPGVLSSAKVLDGLLEGFESNTAASPQPRVLQTIQQ